jgi:hypothetical protein
MEVALSVVVAMAGTPAAVVVVLIQRPSATRRRRQQQLVDSIGIRARGSVRRRAVGCFCITPRPHLSANISDHDYSYVRLKQNV